MQRYENFIVFPNPTRFVVQKFVNTQNPHETPHVPSSQRPIKHVRPVRCPPLRILLYYNIIIFIILLTSTNIPCTPSTNTPSAPPHRPTFPSTLMGRWDAGRCDAEHNINKVKVRKLFGSLMELYYLCIAKVIQVLRPRCDIGLLTITYIRIDIRIVICDK